MLGPDKPVIYLHRTACIHSFPVKLFLPGLYRYGGDTCAAAVTNSVTYPVIRIMCNLLYNSIWEVITVLLTYLD